MVGPILVVRFVASEFSNAVTEFAAISLATQQMAAPGLPNRYDCSFHVQRDRPRKPSAGEELIYDLDFGPVLFPQHATGFPFGRDGAFMSNSTEFQSLAIVAADLTEPDTMRILLVDDDIRVGKQPKLVSRFLSFVPLFRAVREAIRRVWLSMDRGGN